MVKNPPANAGDTKDAGLILGSGRSPGGEFGTLLQYSYLENPMDRGALWATVHGVAKSQTRPKCLNIYARVGIIIVGSSSVHRILVFPEWTKDITFSPIPA